MNVKLERTNVAAITLLAACAHRIPPPEEVQDLAPIRWPQAKPMPLRSEVDTGPFVLLANNNGDLRFGEVTIRGLVEPSAATSLDRGYAVRHRWNEPGADRYAEVFRGSPIVSLFQRGDVRGHTIEVPDRFSEMLAFDGFTAVSGSRGAARLDPRSTKKPFVILRSSADDEGVVLFFPHPPEIRRWYIDDYVVTSTLAVAIDATSTIEIRFPPATLDARSTFDFAVYVMPYRGTARDALENFAIGDIDLLSPEPPFGGSAGYWSQEDDLPLGPKQGGLRMLRYSPVEFASFMDSSKLYYGHPNGRAWGDMTSTMKGIRTDPLSTRALLRDQAFRMLTFFVEAGREKGAPPNLVMHPQWTEALDDPQKIRGIVFCQYWEYRLGELERLFDSPHLEDSEKAAIYDDLQSAKKVFDPSAGAFARPTPNGGLWFQYLDVPISEDEPWIINTHTTNVGNAGRFARLAKKMDRPSDYDYWRTLFVRGIDGLELAIAEDWMWQPHDENELCYAKGGNGPREYHGFMLFAWVPDLVRLSAELAPDRVPSLMSLMRRLMKARFIVADPRTLTTATALISELEALRQVP